MTETNNVSSIAGEVFESIPRRIEWYGKMLTVAEELLFAFLERFGVDPAHFLFLSLILLLIVLSVLSKWKISRWILLGVVVVMALAWIL